MPWPLGFTLALLLLAVGCSPPTAPLYRDYRAAGADAAEDPAVAEGPAVEERLRSALREAGWEVAPPTGPGVVSTAPRTVSNWGLYRTVVSLDAAPLPDGHVRVLFHPHRRYITGGRSKIPALSGGLRRALVGELDEALAAYGFRSLDAPAERDEAAVEGGG